MKRLQQIIKTERENTLMNEEFPRDTARTVIDSLMVFPKFIDIFKHSNQCGTGCAPPEGKGPLPMTETPAFNPQQRFIRIVHARADGWVEFEFAMGEPRLFVEMLMQRADFEQFCKDQQVTPTEGSLPETTTGDITPCR